ncbi:MAG: polysulfide reductase NrfD [Deltaproteobacteria bacterium]|nr:polysulfide reductase NrfD [Deltaproteobacteria bacterium]
MLAFIIDSIKEMLRGGPKYHAWLGGLTLIILIGVYFYGQQLAHGMIVTGMSDQVSWGAYIANFTYLVGVAAAAVMLVIPAYIFDRKDVKEVVLLGECVAIAACIMCMTFVTVDLGRPERIWHMLPLLGKFNFPISLLAWDVVVLTVYLLLNLGILVYIVYTKYSGHEPNKKAYYPWVLLSVVWAFSIHTVTAFLLVSNVSRPFWHTAILAPRFLASAFTSGPALIILGLQVISMITEFKVKESVLRVVGLIVTVSLQINLFFLGVELFTEFYHSTEHVESATYLFMGEHGYHGLVPWIWSAITMNLIALVIMSTYKLRANQTLFNVACALAIVGVWIEKGMGLIIPGFIPTPLGEILEYSPSWAEIWISIAVWCIGFLIFTLLAKVVLAVELGRIKAPGANPGAAKTVAQAD